MTDVMLDLESLGNGKSCAICQIGAVYFDRYTGKLGKEFYMNVDVKSCIKIGLELDSDTVYWWLNQSENARQSILAEPKVNIADALNQFSQFIIEAKTIWSHATFDFVAVSNAYRKAEIVPPKGFYKMARDIRTLIDLAKVSLKDISREGVHHDALADAKHQVKYCVEAFNKVRNVKSLSVMLKHIEGKI